MANEVYANSMEVSCKAGAGKTIAAFPDVCFTPPQTPATPPGVPIPYPNTGMASDCSDGSSSVKISGQPVMLKNKSYFKQSTGDEAGAAPKKGLINNSTRGKLYFTAWSMDVKVEGENVVRNLDLTTSNHACPNANAAAAWPHIDAVSPAGLPKKPCEADCPTTVKPHRKKQLRKRTPRRRHRRNVNEGWPRTCKACGENKRRLAADHVFPLDEIVKIPGFACLTYKEQKEVINTDENFVGLCKSCNSSKCAKLWKDFKQNKAKGIKISQSVRNKAEAAATAAKSHVVKAVRSKKGNC